jgi:hypothetical protein
MVLARARSRLDLCGLPRVGAPGYCRYVKAFYLTLGSGAFSLVGEVFAHISSLFARVGFVVSFIGDSLARPRCRLTAAHALLTRVRLRVVHLKLDLVGLELSVPTLAAPTSRRPTTAGELVDVDI